MGSANVARSATPPDDIRGVSVNKAAPDLLDASLRLLRLSAALQADGETRSVVTASSIRRRSAAWTNDREVETDALLQGNSGSARRSGRHNCQYPTDRSAGPKVLKKGSLKPPYPPKASTTKATERPCFIGFLECSSAETKDVVTGRRGSHDAKRSARAHLALRL